MANKIRLPKNLTDNAGQEKEPNKQPETKSAAKPPEKPQEKRKAKAAPKASTPAKRKAGRQLGQKTANPSKPPPDDPLHGLTLTTLEQRFIQNLVVCNNRFKAYIDAGGINRRPSQAAYELLKKHDVAEYERRLRAMQRDESLVDAVKLMNIWWELIEADPAELIDIRTENCRYCWGAGHRYYWIDAVEYEEAQANEDAAAAKDKRDPQTLDCAGGFGFDQTDVPHPKCPRCRGEGKPRIIIKDTRLASPGSRRLYDGVKQKRGGEIEIKLLSREKALDSLARAMGVYQDGLNLGTKEDDPLRTLIEQIAGRTLKPVVTDPEQGSSPAAGLPDLTGELSADDPDPD